MIFGFNTDVKHGDTVYHVQSEAREHELVLQTQVFVRGRCVGKRATSYADKLSQGGFTDQMKEQSLRDQHRLVLDSIRDGKLDSILDKRETPEILAVKELNLEWLNANSVHADRNLSMRLRVTEGGAGHGLRQAFAELLLQEPNHFTDTLQGESAVAQLTNHGDFGEIFHGVEATVPFPRRYHDAALIPPLQLAWGDPG